MSFAAGILEKYRRAPQSGPLPGTTLAHKPALKRTAAGRIDMQRQSRELFRLVKPKLEAENVKRRLELARFSRGIARDKEELLVELRAERELVIKQALMTRKALENAVRDENQSSVKPVVSDEALDVVKKLLGETREEMEIELRKTARKEAEAALRRFREDVEYNRLRGAYAWR